MNLNVRNWVFQPAGNIEALVELKEGDELNGLKCTHLSPSGSVYLENENGEKFRVADHWDKIYRNAKGCFSDTLRFDSARDERRAYRARGYMLAKKIRGIVGGVPRLVIVDPQSREPRWYIGEYKDADCVFTTCFRMKHVRSDNPPQGIINVLATPANPEHRLAVISTARWCAGQHFNDGSVWKPTCEGGEILFEGNFAECGVYLRKQVFQPRDNFYKSWFEGEPTPRMVKRMLAERPEIRVDIYKGDFFHPEWDFKRWYDPERADMDDWEVDCQLAHFIVSRYLGLEGIKARVT